MIESMNAAGSNFKIANLGTHKPHTVSSVARNVSTKIYVCRYVSYLPTGIYYLCLNVIS